MAKSKIFIIINVDWFFLLHRLPLALALKEEFDEIYVLAKDTGRSDEIKKLGFNFINIDFDRKGLNIIKEVNVLFQLHRFIRKKRPDIIHSITIKPIIYSLFISKFINIKLINTVCGLGYVFLDLKKTFLKYFIIHIYRLAYLNSNSHTFFENKDDLDSFLEKKIFRNNNYHLIKGVGVNLKKFTNNKKGHQNDIVNIILPARMLWSKGVKEFIEAANLLHEKYYGKVFFKMYGMIDEENRASISKKYLVKSGIKNYLKWFGFVDDMVSVFNDSDIVVLPSYKEGLPVTLMEACAMGKPIITTDTNGCRDCVDNEINGYLVPVKSINKLALAIEKLILSKELRLFMSENSRKKAEKEFDQKNIIEEYINLFVSI